MNASLSAKTGCTTPAGGPLDAVLRDAAREFDAPIALFSRHLDHPDGTEPSTQASAPVTSSSGVRLGMLCVLGLPTAAPPPAKIARLNALADRVAAILQRDPVPDTHGAVAPPG